MCAFGAHAIKVVSRSQLCAAAKSLLSKDIKKQLNGAERNKFIKPLAYAFLESNIVTIEDGANIENLSRANVNKTGTF